MEAKVIEYNISSGTIRWRKSISITAIAGIFTLDLKILFKDTEYKIHNDAIRW